MMVVVMMVMMMVMTAVVMMMVVVLCHPFPALRLSALRLFLGLCRYDAGVIHPGPVPIDRDSSRVAHSVQARQCRLARRSMSSARPLRPKVQRFSCPCASS
jgi:hypothetical protein